MANDKVPLHISDLLTWIQEGTEEELSWEAGTKPMWEDIKEEEEEKKYDPKKTLQQALLHAKFKQTNEGLNMDDVITEQVTLGRRLTQYVHSVNILSVEFVSEVVSQWYERSSLILYSSI